jgi:hypothetical protein
MSFKYTPATLRKLEQLFEEARYTVRYEKGTFQSGYCVLEDRRIAVINRFLNAEGRINALLEILPGVPVVEDELSSEMLKFYRQLVQPAQTEDGNASQGSLNL